MSLKAEPVPPREFTATSEARLLQALDLHLPPITDLG
jgi:hypothetical protein